MLFVFAAAHNCYARGHEYGNHGNSYVADQGAKSFQKLETSDFVKKHHWAGQTALVENTPPSYYKKHSAQVDNTIPSFGRGPHCTAS